MTTLHEEIQYFDRLAELNHVGPALSYQIIAPITVFLMCDCSKRAEDRAAAAVQKLIKAQHPLVRNLDDNGNVLVETTSCAQGAKDPKWVRDPKLLRSIPVSILYNQAVLALAENILPETVDCRETDAGILYFVTPDGMEHMEGVVYEDEADLRERLTEIADHAAAVPAPGM